MKARRAMRKVNSYGWILIHTKKEWTEGSPLEQLYTEFEVGDEYEWRWKHPFKNARAGNFHLLFEWEGKVFGYASASKIRKIFPSEEYYQRGYRVAFVLHEYKQRKPVPLREITRRKANQSGTIVLDQGMLDIYSVKSMCGPLPV